MIWKLWMKKVMIESDDDIDEEKSDLSSDGDDEELRTYVEIVKGMYKGYFAVVTLGGYGDEVEINYFENKEKWWNLEEHDLSSGERNKLKVTKKCSYGP